jgi:hypothetical protein
MRRLDRVTRVLIVIAVAALAMRVGYIAFAKKGPCTISVAGVTVGRYHSECTGDPTNGKPNDQVYYNAAANHLADGGGFTEPLPPRTGPAADHPPLTVVALAAVSLAFEHVPLVWLADATHLPGKSHAVYTHVREQRYFMALVGALNVLLVGLLARRIGGDRVAIVAAAIAAVYPNLWVNDGLLFSETIAITCVLAAMLWALRCARRPTLGSFVALGAACALAGMARAESLLLVPLLVLPTAWSVRAQGGAAAMRRAATAVGAALLVVAPWFVYNQARFTSTVMISTNDGLALAGSNCDRSYYGPAIGLWTPAPECVFSEAQLAKLGDQSEVSRAYRTRAFDYMKTHKTRLLLVVAPARLGRVWGFFRPVDMIDYNVGESRERWVSWAGLVSYYALFAGAIGGVGVMLRSRRHFALWVLAVPTICVTIVAALTYGQTRLRATAEPSLVVLASVAFVGLFETMARRNSGSPGSRSR